jgi:outer membrane protein assembly factor BamB
MRRMVPGALLFCTFIIQVSGEDPSSDAAMYWPQWRGPLANGVALQGNPPVEWSETKNIRWKVTLPGKGSSSPIVWGDYIFVTSAIPTQEATPEKTEQTGGRRGRSKPTVEQEFVVLALNRLNGDILWQKPVRRELPHEGIHPTGTWASNSAVTDGERVYAYFGSRGLYCLDMRGKLIWEQDLGDMKKIRSFGEGSSPALYGDKIVILWDHEGQSFIVALDKDTGNEVWRVNRDEQTSWSTPLIVESSGVKQVITSATNRIRSYDLEDGTLIWECGGMTRNVIPSPISVDGIVILMSGFRGNALRAIRIADAKGDIGNSDSLIWKIDRDTPYAPSPLLYDEVVYFLKGNSGILSAFGAKTGEHFYGPQRLEGIDRVYSSPVGVAGHVYITDREGNTLVIRHGRDFEILATNTLDDGIDASPAIVGDHIYMRGQKNLYCIAPQE